MTEPRIMAGALVLVVDDEPDQVEMYAYALEDGGFRVETAYTGQQALARAHELVPDVIVLDLRLPDMSGWDVCGILKGDAHTKHIPIVILTAAASPNLAEQAAKAGCAAHLVKPCYPQELTDAIRSIVAAA